MTDTERIRVTRIERTDWTGGPTLRNQKRRKTGNEVQGPEFPVQVTSQLIRAVETLAAGESRPAGVRTDGAS
jgi:hypothetical protein